MITEDELAMVAYAYEQSTKGPWRRCKTGHLTTIQETREWLAAMVDYEPDRPQLEMVVAMVDGSTPPAELESVESHVCPAVTGNGPTSEANALFIELAHNYMPALISEIVRLRNLERAFTLNTRAA